MKVLLAAVLAAAYLSILWGPAYLVARRHPTTWRALRFIWPSQLVATFALWFIAEAIGLQNPAGWFVAATAVSSVAGAAICRLLGWYDAR